MADALKQDGRRCSLATSHPNHPNPPPHPLPHHRSQPAPPAPDLQASEPEEEEADESCRLSVSQKLALFNNLSLPGMSSSSSQGPRPPLGAPPERRRQKGARYRTQPITVEEVSMVGNYSTKSHLRRAFSWTSVPCLQCQLRRHSSLIF